VNEVPVFFRDVHRIKTGKAGGVIHQTVKRAKLGLHLSEHRPDFSHFGEIRLENGRAATLFRRLSRFPFGGLKMDRYVKAMFPEPNADRSSDPFRAAGNKNPRFGAHLGGNSFKGGNGTS
jgi:hypothetical protein